ncbi:MAG: ribulose-phosphate 3-epimerase [Fidelibacterota bacterium]|nr:MAG: ribulose-phosphate 3-epimerase [Candidatus Neomarinimicrobiota bacterium]
MYYEWRKPVKRIISPSLLAADFTRLDEQIHSVEEAGASRLHLDVMDGNFVPNITFGPLIVEAINRLTDLRLDTHLMIEKPHRYFEPFVQAGADTLIIHVEASENLDHDLSTIRTLGASPGVALNPDTDFNILLPHLNLIDYILIMSVFPGFGAQSFIENTLENMHKAVAARKDHAYLIAVDGGVNTQTIDRVFSTGIDIAVVGSNLFGAPDILLRYREL